MQQPLSLSLPADEGMSGSRLNLALTEHAQILQATPPCFLPDSKRFLSGLTAALCVRDYEAVDSWSSNLLIQMDGKHCEQSVRVCED